MSVDLSYEEDWSIVHEIYRMTRIASGRVGQLFSTGYTLFTCDVTALNLQRIPFYPLYNSFSLLFCLSIISLFSSAPCQRSILVLATCSPATVHFSFRSASPLSFPCALSRSFPPQPAKRQKQNAPDTCIVNRDQWRRGRVLGLLYF